MHLGCAVFLGRDCSTRFDSSALPLGYATKAVSMDRVTRRRALAALFACTQEGYCYEDASALSQSCLLAEQEAACPDFLPCRPYWELC
jgi:hypothetical protein